MCADQNPNEIKDKRTSRGKEKIDEIEIRYDDDDDASPACCGASPREGDGGGRGDVGSPSMRECRFPRSEFTTATFSPRLAAALAALDVFAVGVRGDHRVVGAGDEGVAVMDVDPDGPAAAKGIEQGDIILDVAGSSVSKPSEIAERIKAAEASGRKAVLMRVKSTKGVTRFVAVALNKAG